MENLFSAHKKSILNKNFYYNFEKIRKMMIFKIQNQHFGPFLKKLYNGSIYNLQHKQKMGENEIWQHEALSITKKL